MNLKQLEAFVMIADNKSFSLTAEKLYLTQPTVSAYISKLESELGEKLFYRTTKEVALTEAGKKIYIYAKDIIELAEKIENAFKESPEEGPRRMVISASSIPGTYLLPGILAEFSSAFPNVKDNGFRYLHYKGWTHSGEPLQFVPFKQVLQMLPYHVHREIYTDSKSV